MGGCWDLLFDVEFFDCGVILMYIVFIVFLDVFVLNLLFDVEIFFLFWLFLFSKGFVKFDLLLICIDEVVDECMDDFGGWLGKECFELNCIEMEEFCNWFLFVLEVWRLLRDWRLEGGWVCVIGDLFIGLIWGELDVFEICLIWSLFCLLLCIFREEEVDDWLILLLFLISLDCLLSLNFEFWCLFLECLVVENVIGMVLCGS